MNRLNTAFLGTVEENRDPERLGRLKVRVPQVYGVSEVGTDAIPWAIPFGLPAGGMKESGGISFLPENGDQVIILFLDGEPEKPCWSWSMQSVRQAKEYKFRSYDKNSGSPDAMRITRYGHTIEFSRGSVIVTNSQGYSLVLQNGVLPNSGYLQLRTPMGQVITVDDEIKLAQFFFTLDFQLEVGRDIDVRAADINLRALRSLTGLVTDSCSLTAGKDVSVTTGASVSLKAATDVSASAGAHISLAAGGKVDITGGGVVSLSGSALNVTAAVVTVKAETIVLSAGGRTLTISSAGFDFV